MLLIHKVTEHNIIWPKTCFINSVNLNRWLTYKNSHSLAKNIANAYLMSSRPTNRLIFPLQLISQVSLSQESNLGQGGQFQLLSAPVSLALGLQWGELQSNNTWRVPSWPPCLGCKPWGQPTLQPTLWKTPVEMLWEGLLLTFPSRSHGVWIWKKSFFEQGGRSMHWLDPSSESRTDTYKHRTQNILCTES